MKFSLVDEWKQAWKWISVNCMLIAASIQGAWMYIPEEMRSTLPPHLVNGATILLLFFGVIGRVTQQKPRKKDNAANPELPKE